MSTLRLRQASGFSFSTLAFFALVVCRLNEFTQEFGEIVRGFGFIQDGVNVHAFLISTGHANNANQIDVQCEDGRAAPLEECFGKSRERQITGETGSSSAAKLTSLSCVNLYPNGFGFSMLLR